MHISAVSEHSLGIFIILSIFLITLHESNSQLKKYAVVHIGRAHAGSDKGA